MSPITKELEIIINLKKELNSLMGIITLLNEYYQSHLRNSNIHGMLVVINNIKKQLLNIITKIIDLWTSYLQLNHTPGAEQSINEQVNISIINISVIGETIKSSPLITRQTFDTVITNIHTLTNPINTAIRLVSQLETILDRHSRRLLASTSLRRPTGLLPRPLSEAPSIQRQPNLTTRPASLIRQQVINFRELLPTRASSHSSSHSSSRSSSRSSSGTSLDNLRLGYGKKFFKKRRLTHRKRDTRRNNVKPQKSKKYYKIRRA